MSAPPVPWSEQSGEGAHVGRGPSGHSRTSAFGWRGLRVALARAHGEPRLASGTAWLAVLAERGEPVRDAAQKPPNGSLGAADDREATEQRACVRQRHDDVELATAVVARHGVL